MISYFPSATVAACVTCDGPLLPLLQVKHPTHTQDGLRTSNFVEITETICLDCSLIQRFPMPTGPELRSFYSHNSPKFGDFILLEGYDQKSHRDNQVSFLLESLGGKTASSTKVLDVGAFTGSLVRALVDAGFDAYGCDTSVPIDQTLEAIRDRMFSGDLSDYKNQASFGTNFDVISLSHVLEHTIEPVGFLTEASTLLSNAGVIFIEVPDCARTPSDSFALFSNLEHTLNFTEETLIAVAERAGLSVSTMEHFTEPVVGHVLRGIFTVSDSDSSFKVGTTSDASNNNVLEMLQIILQHRVASDVLRARARSAIRYAKGRPIALFGGGIAGLRVLELLTRLGGRAHFFLDSDPRKHDFRINDLEVRPPESLSDFEGLVIITSKAYRPEIERRVAEIRPDLDTFCFFPDV